MAAGRHGVYYNKLKENNANFDGSKREVPYSKAEYERLKNGNNQDHERGRNRAPGGRGKDNGRAPQKDFRERDLLNNGGYNSGSSRNDSGYLRTHEHPDRVNDREPGELSSDSGSDNAIDLETHEKSDQSSKIEEATRSHSHSPSKKRKFSPIVWDRDEKEVGDLSKSRFSIANTTLSPPLVPKSNQQSPDSIPATVTNQSPDSIPEQSPGNTSVDIGKQNSSGFEPDPSLSSSPPSQNPHNIRSSRWANDANEDEAHRETSENRYHNRSSSSDDNNPDKDYMEMDDDHGKLIHSNTDSETDDVAPNSQPSYPPQRTVNMLQGCRSVNEFERLNKIDEGTYGVVFRAKDKKTGEIVALKKVKMEKEREGFPLTALREINILLSFHHPSIVDVKEVVVGSNLDSIFMVMEYMEHDLKALMETMKQPFSQSEVKCLMIQLLEGTKYLHDNWVLHRDLKTSNLLLNNRGELKICDFGLARQYGSPLKPYTHLVVTLWYRAPELLLGAKQYSTAIDMWSLGCIMAELLSKQALFNGKTEFDQIDKIFKTLGTPNETIWPGFSKLPGVKVNFVNHQLSALGDFLVWLSGLHWYNLLRRKFPATSFTGSPVLSDAGFDLLNKLLTYDPQKRITAEEALKHVWFQEVPLPKSKDFMPTFPAHHAQDRRVRRVMKSPDPLEEQRRKELQQAKLGTGGGLFG